MIKCTKKDNETNLKGWSDSQKLNFLKNNAFNYKNNLELTTEII